MAQVLTSFKDMDIQGQTGFSALAGYLRDGEKLYKWVDDFLKQRAKAEEEYGKALQKLQKSTSNHGFGSLQDLLEELCRESEAEASLHLLVADKIQEESFKAAEFKDKQKEERKMHEDSVQRSFKTKADLHKQMQSSRQNYDICKKALEKAEMEAEKLNSRIGPKLKETEKAKKMVIQSQSNVTKSQDEYQRSITLMDNAKMKWAQDQDVACDAFRRMAEERIQFIRNSVWVVTNLVSDSCCQLDDMQEKIRQAAEKCDEIKDVMEFMQLKAISYKPPAEVEHTSPRSSSSPPIYSVDFSPTFQTSSMPQSPYELEDTTDITIVTALYDSTPQSWNEMEMQKGDRIRLISWVDQMWIEGNNLRTNDSGLVPINFVQFN